MLNDWVELGALAKAPTVGEVAEFEAGGTTVCVANVDGELRAMDNVCPHRGAPLGQGTLEGAAVVCPWHAWCFSTETGRALPPDSGEVQIFDVRVDDDVMWIRLGQGTSDANGLP